MQPVASECGGEKVTANVEQHTEGRSTPLQCTLEGRHWHWQQLASRKSILPKECSEVLKRILEETLQRAELLRLYGLALR